MSNDALHDTAIAPAQRDARNTATRQSFTGWNPKGGETIVESELVEIGDIVDTTASTDSDPLLLQADLVDMIIAGMVEGRSSGDYQASVVANLPDID